MEGKKTLATLTVFFEKGNWNLTAAPEQIKGLKVTGGKVLKADYYSGLGSRGPSLEISVEFEGSPDKLIKSLRMVLEERFGEIMKLNLLKEVAK